MVKSVTFSLGQADDYRFVGLAALIAASTSGGLSLHPAARCILFNDRGSSLWDQGVILFLLDAPCLSKAYKR